MHGWINGQIKWVDESMEENKDDKWMDEWMQRGMEGLKDVWMDP